MDDFRVEKEFQEFVSAHRHSWIRMAASVLKNRHEAEDVVQETLAVLWKNRNTRKVENPAAYAARAVWVNALKRRKREKRLLSLEGLPEPAVDPREEDPEGWDEVSPSALDRAMEGLSEAQRSVIRMKYYAGLSFREIGKALRISLNTAASRCRYALAALKEALGTRRHPGDRR